MVTKSTIVRVLCQCFVFLLLTNYYAHGQSLSVGEYAGSMMACWTPYLMSIMEPLINMANQATRTKRQAPAVTGMTGMNSLLDAIKKSFVSSCGTTLERAIQCHQKLDGMAGYRLVNTERLKSVIQQLCNRVDTLGTDFRCVGNDKVGGMVGCFSQVTYSDSVCGVTQQLKNCVDAIFSDCPLSMQTFFDDIVDVASIDRCVDTSLPDTKRCTGMGSLTTVASCYTSFITKMALGASDPKSTYVALCRDGTVNTAMDCHSAVQDMCSISYINVVEMKMMVAHTCSNINEFEGFGMCLNSTDAFGFLNCINLLQPAGDVCAVTNGYDTCTTSAFQRCNAPQQKLVEYGFDLMTVPCPDGSCSRMEHGITLAMCWYPTIATLIPWDTILRNPAAGYDFGAYFTAFCTTHRKTIAASIDCHFAADDRCGWGLFTRNTVDRFVDAMCTSPASLLDIVHCVTPKLQDYNKCSLQMKEFNPLDDKYFCQISQHTQKCVGIMLSGCNQGVRDTFDKAMAIMSEAGCYTGHQTTSELSATRDNNGFKTTLYTTGVQTTPSGTVQNKPLELAVVTSLVLALNANLNGFVQDWMHMLGNMERQRDEF